MVFYLFIFFLIFLSMFLNVVFFDTPQENSDLLYSRLDFRDFYSSVFSTFTVFTNENVINLFNQNMKFHPGYLTVLLPVIFVVYYVVLAFLVAILTYYYSKIIRQEIRKLKNFPKFIHVFRHFCNKDGIVSYSDINGFIEVFYRDPHKINFDGLRRRISAVERKTETNAAGRKMDMLSFQRFEKRRRTLIKNEFIKKKEFQKRAHNSKHFKAFDKFRKAPVYRVLLVLNDTLLAIAPILIINSNISEMNDFWFVVTANLSIFSVIDAFLHFIFALHKISRRRRNHYVVSVFSSIGIVFLSIIIWIKPLKIDEPLSQTYLYLFLFFSGFCFCKISTLVDQLYHTFPFFVDMLELLSELAPFYYQVITIILINMFIFSILGRPSFV